MRTLRTLCTTTGLALLASFPGAAMAAAAQDAGAAAGEAGAAAQQPLVIRGGTVHPISSDPYVGTVVVRDGRIAAVGGDVDAPAGARVIDASGLHVYPGIFDAVSHLGLTEIGAVDVTSDLNEMGDFTPHLQARTAVHPASELIPVARANGITHTMALPGGGEDASFPGQGSVFHLAGWTIEEMDIERAAVMVMGWPEIETRDYDWQTDSWTTTPYEEAREEYDAAVHRLAEWLETARQYARNRAAGIEQRPNLRLEALARAANGEIPVLARVDEEQYIRDVVRFAEEQGLDLIIGGASEGFEVASLLAEHDVPVILGSTQSMPSGPDAPYDEAYTNPGVLYQAGVTIAFASYDASDSRLVPYQAAMAIPYGLPREAALRAITINPARILGLGDELGTIEPGKIANLIVTDGDPLEITTRVQHLIIDGQVTSTMNKHRELFLKYRSRPVTSER